MQFYGFNHFVDSYGVMGSPIQHTKSPYLHHLFAKQTHQDIVYTAFLVNPTELRQALDEFQINKGLGLNITSPLKKFAFNLMDEVTPRAARAQAINTISFTKDGRRLGDTTDGVGLATDLVSNKNIPIAGKNILILGAGGAAWSIIESLLVHKPQSITITNRTESKAFFLAEAFADLAKLKVISLAKLNDDLFDIIINTTSAAHQDGGFNLPSTLKCNHSHCYDLAYNQEISGFLQWAKAGNALSYHDGWGMLVEQAAESFQIWRGVRPSTQALLRP